MTAAWVPPRATYNLRIFAISLVLVVLFLAALLFAVDIEAITPATGIITARDLREVRAPLSGLVEHKLHPGDELPSGEVLATVRNDDLRGRLHIVEDQLKEAQSRGDPTAALSREAENLKAQLAQSVLHVPADGPWLVLESKAAPLSAVRTGDVIAVIVPIDPQTHQPRDLQARLEVDEKHWGSLAPGQTVRLRSAVHNHRLHGVAEARIDRLEPYGEPTNTGERRFHATATITSVPYPLPLGSSFHAEVVVGKKLVYRVILEH